MENDLNPEYTSNVSEKTFLEQKISKIKEQLHDLRLERESFMEENPPTPIQTCDKPKETTSKGINTECSL